MCADLARRLGDDFTFIFLMSVVVYKQRNVCLGEEKIIKNMVDVLHRNEMLVDR